jgi:RNA polymerase sigma factor (sigma-70 family)
MKNELNLNEVFESSEKLVQGFIYKNFKSICRDNDDLENLNQEAWLIISREIHKYNSELGQVSTFIYTILQKNIPHLKHQINNSRSNDRFCQLKRTTNYYVKNYLNFKNEISEKYNEKPSIEKLAEYSFEYNFFNKVFKNNDLNERVRRFKKFERTLQNVSRIRKFEVRNDGDIGASDSDNLFIDKSKSVEDMVIDKMSLSKTIHHLRNRISVTNFKIFYLYCFEAITVNEISKKLNMTSNAVSSRIKRTRMTIKEIQDQLIS